MKTLIIAALYAFNWGLWFLSCLFVALLTTPVYYLASSLKKNRLTCGVVVMLAAALIASDVYFATPYGEPYRGHARHLTWSGLLIVFLRHSPLLVGISVLIGYGRGTEYDVISKILQKPRWVYIGHMILVTLIALGVFFNIPNEGKYNLSDILEGLILSLPSIDKLIETYLR